MKRTILLVLGVLTLLLGLALVAAGGVVAALLGQKESISTQPARMSGTGVALVAEHIRVDESNVPMPQGLGTLTLSVTSPDGRAVFAGTATPDDLDTYLTGAPYDVVVDLASGGKATTRPVPGTQQPAPPAGQTIWVQQSTGTTARISSDLDPTTALVVMNSDATPGVTADVVVTYRIAGAWTGSWIAVGVGVLLLLVSVLFFWRARVARRRRDARRAEAAAAVVPVTATDVLPAAPAAPSAPEVPAWAAAPVALSGAELAGPPTGGLVVERSADGAEAVVSASEPPPAAPPPPEAGWYPGSVPAAVAAAAAAAAGSEEQPGGPVVPVDASDHASAEDTGNDDADSHDAVSGDADSHDGEVSPGPTASDDAVDTWHDETRPVPVVDTAAPGAVEVEPTRSDTAVYDELRAWFRDEPGTPARPDGEG